MAIGCSSGWTRRNSRSVRLLPLASAELETISDTTSPAPKRLAWRRTNQLPMPASGASTTRFGMVIPPRVQLSVSARSGTPFRLVSRVALVDEAQPGEREEVFDLVDLLAERHDVLREPAGGDHG